MDPSERVPVLGRRRGRAWTPVAYGIHRPSDVDDPAVADLLGWQLALPPFGRFTHLTAATAYGWWLPPLPDDLPVFAAVPRQGNRPQRAGLRVARHEVLAEPVMVDGIRLDPPAEALLACARHLSLLDVVVLVDSALRSEAVTTDHLGSTAGAVRRGAPLLRRALSMADARSDSPFETLLRILHEACEVPVQPQFELTEDGALVAKADLWIVGTNALHEYDGDCHLPKRQQRKDLRRVRRVGNVGWVRRGYTDDDVLHHGVAILRDADLSLGREHVPAHTTVAPALGRLGVLAQRQGVAPTSPRSG